jgi:hypothetical protein
MSERPGNVDSYEDDEGHLPSVVWVPFLLLLCKVMGTVWTLSRQDRFVATREADEALVDIWAGRLQRRVQGSLVDFANGYRLAPQFPRGEGSLTDSEVSCERFKAHALRLA